MFRCLGDQRSFIGLDNLARLSDLLSSLVEGKIMGQDDKVLAEELVRRGLLLKADDGSYAFISPLHMHYYVLQV